MLTENEKKILAAYDKRLQKPKLEFILVNGLIWSVLVLVIMLLEQYFIRGKSFKQQWDEGLPISLIFLLFAGLLYGWIIRVLIKRKYDQLKEKDN
jgi:hypothetical protein